MSIRMFFSLGYIWNIYVFWLFLGCPLKNKYFLFGWSLKLPIFSFVTWHFDIVSKKPLPNPGTWNFILMFSSMSFSSWNQVYGFFFLVHFYIWCEVRVQIPSCACAYIFVPALFLEKTILSPLNYLVILTSNQ